MSSVLDCKDLSKSEREWMMITAEIIASMIRDVGDVYTLDSVIEQSLHEVEVELKRLLNCIMNQFPEVYKTNEPFLFQQIVIVPHPDRPAVPIRTLRKIWKQIVRSMSQPWRDMYEL